MAKVRCVICGREFDPKLEEWELDEYGRPICSECLSLFNEWDEDEEYSVEEWLMEHPLEPKGDVDDA